LSRPSFSRIVSSSPLYMLVLTSGKADIYLVKRTGTSLILPSSGTSTPLDAARLASQSINVPWVILVDQSEETFWGGAMPPLKGMAKEAWIKRMADQSGTESPYRWSEIQGKSSSHEGQVRVLGYTLGRPEALTPWLDALHSSNARIRGAYAPVMLLTQALKVLKLQPSKSADQISVLVTPHAEGLRQTVSVGGRVRFSRLALHTDTDGSQWFHIVHTETTRLREYLVGNGLLKNERTGMRIDCVLPTSATGLSIPAAANAHSKDQYHWLSEALPSMVYATALASAQSWRQLAPALYRKRDISSQITSSLRISCLVVLVIGLVYVGMQAAHLWQKLEDTQAATAAANNANQRYQAIAKTFAKTPLTSAQLLDMSKRWNAIQSQNPPDMRYALVAAGQTLERHPHMLVEEIMWVADTNLSGDLGDTLGGSAGLVTPPQQQNGVPLDPNAADKEKKEVTALILRGIIRGIPSDDLRGTRDALEKLEQDFNRHPKIRAEITRRPLDLSAKSAVTGSGTQDKSELSFEIKLWQR
jgi:hypothetical protein